MFYLAWEVGKIWICPCGEKGNVVSINEFKYGQAWKIWPSPLSLSLRSTFNDTYFGMKFWVPVKLFYIALFPQYCNAIILYIFDILILNGFTLRFQMIKKNFSTAQPSQTYDSYDLPVEQLIKLEPSYIKKWLFILK